MLHLPPEPEFLGHVPLFLLFLRYSENGIIAYIYFTDFGVAVLFFFLMKKSVKELAREKHKDLLSDRGAVVNMKQMQPATACVPWSVYAVPIHGLPAHFPHNDPALLRSLETQDL